MTYNEQGKRTSLENLAGRIATKVAQGKGGLGLKTDMAYTVKHIQKGLVRRADVVVRVGNLPFTRKVLNPKDMAKELESSGGMSLWTEEDNKK